MNKKRLILISSVVSVHLFFFFFNFKSSKAPPPPKKSIVVNTYAPPPPPPSRRVQEGAHKKAATKSAPTSAPIKKSHSKRVTKPSANSQKHKILQEIKETLSKIETKAPPKSSLSLPKEIQALSIDSGDKKEETDYFISLAHSLKEGLELPEMGEVKLKLTISHSGRVLKLEILSAASIKNRRYLELNLPSMQLPPFSEDLKNENAHTFTLNFCNAP
jgi:hypothetical protein